ncbi:ankyrin repeat protein, partial [Teladorsagia circumcincta]
MPKRKTALVRGQLRGEGNTLPTKSAPNDRRVSVAESVRSEKGNAERRDTLIDLSLADFQTKVLYMAKHEQWPTMESELDNVKRSDFSMSDQHGFTALMFAVKEGKRILFEKLLAKGADINVVTKDLRNVAHICAMYSDKDMLDAIIARNRELLRRPGGVAGVPLFMPNKKGALGLHSAAAAGFNEVVKMLIARGTNVDIRTK